MDEAQRYMRRKSAERRRELGMPERFPVDEPLPAKVELRPRPGTHAAPVEPRPPAGPPPPFRSSRLRRYRELFRKKAERLMETGSVTIETNGTPIACRLIRFHDGSAVFEDEHVSPWSSGSGRSHYEPGTVTVEDIAYRLEFACLNTRFRPIAGQEV